MTKENALPEGPPAYPEGSTFGQLLKWHLEVWGTHPNCSISKPNPRWTLSKFAQFVHEEGTLLESAIKNLKNWRSGRSLPSIEDEYRVQRIYQELFGEEPNLQSWKKQLEDSLERGREKKSTRSKMGKSSVVSNIPPLENNFIGRNDDLKKVVSVFNATNESLAILVQGGPGIGKTELTKAVIHHNDVVARFGERRWFVRLETSTTAEAMKEAIIRAIGCDPHLRFQAAINTLKEKQSLLVLDNLETPWEPAEQREATHEVLANLGTIPKLALLASIRGRQRVDGLRWTSEHYLDELTPNAAIDLFADIGGEWVRNDPHLNDFMRALGGLPLAISLVARHAYDRTSLAPLWREWLRIGTDFAKDEDADEGPLTSLPHSIELSLKSSRMKRRPDALRLFKLLGALPGGMCAQDREALIGAESFNAEKCLLRLGLAVERAGRLDLLPPLREHARRHWGPEQEDRALWEKYFTNLACSLTKLFRQCPPNRRVITEADNIYAALVSMIRSDNCADVPEYLGALIIDAPRFVAPLVKEIVEAAGRYRSRGNKLSEAHCLRGQGEIGLYIFDYGMADSSYKDSIALYRLCNNKIGEADCLFGAGETARGRRKYEIAQNNFKLAQAAYEKFNDMAGMASCLIRLNQHSKAIPILSELGDRIAEAFCLMYMGRLADDVHHLSDIESAYGKARQIFTNAGLFSLAAKCSMSIGLGWEYFREWDKAKLAYASAVTLFKQAGDLIGEAKALDDLGEVSVYYSPGRFEPDHDTANAAHHRAQTLSIERNKIVSRANAFIKESKLLLSNLDFDAAIAAADQAYTLYDQVGYDVGRAVCFARLGEIANHRSDFASARVNYGRAAAIFGEAIFGEEGDDQLDNYQLAEDYLKKIEKMPSLKWQQ